MSSIGSLQPVSRDTDNNAAMYNRWWTNKRKLIRNLLFSSTKRSDIRTSALQDTLVKVSSAIICTSDKLLEHREKKTIPSYKALINPLLDSVALLGHVCTELSYKKRDALKPFLHQDFHPACARSRKPGKLLFGNNLAKTLQELKTTNKLMTNNSSDARHYNRSSGHSKQENNKYQRKPSF